MHEKVKKFWDKEKPDSNTTCSFAVEYEGDVEPIIYSHQMCHANLKSVPAKHSITSFSSSLYRSMDAESAEDFWDWVLDPKESPWRKAFSGKSPKIIKNSQGDTVAFYLPSLRDTPGQLLTSLCMVVRMPYEFPMCINLYKYLRDHKWSALDAFIPTFYLELSKKKVRYRSGNSNHDILHRGCTFDYKALHDGNPKLNRGLFTDPHVITGGYDGATSIWNGKSNQFDVKLKQLVSLKCGYKGAFKEYRVNTVYDESDENHRIGGVDIKEALSKLEGLRTEWHESLQKE